VADPERIPQKIDICMLWPAAKVGMLCSVLPPMLVPLMALHTFGYARCLATMRHPYQQMEPMLDEYKDVQYAVHRRRYDRDSKKIIDDAPMDTPQHISYALSIVGTKRNEFVDDPGEKDAAWLVIERHTLNPKFFNRGENWAWAFGGDTMRYMGASLMCAVFMPAMKRFNTDMTHVWRGQIRMTQVRHPITNFFQTVEDYNKAKHRITSTKMARSSPFSSPT
jgi:hypothetical protein